MSVITCVATVVNKKELVTKEYNGSELEYCGFGLSTDFALLFTTAFKEHLDFVRNMKNGDRVIATLCPTKIVNGNSTNYISCKLLSIEPATITKSMFANSAVDERVVHDNTPVEERTTTRDGKPRLKFNYELLREKYRKDPYEDQYDAVAEWDKKKEAEWAKEKDDAEVPW